MWFNPSPFHIRAAHGGSAINSSFCVRNQPWPSDSRCSDLNFGLNSLKMDTELNDWRNLCPRLLIILLSPNTTIIMSHECRILHILEVRVSRGKNYLLFTSVKTIYVFPRRHAAETGIQFISHPIARAPSSICDCAHTFFKRLRLCILLQASATAHTPSNVCPPHCFSSSP